MSEWQPVIVKIESIKNHPEADRLDIATVMGDYPVIVVRDEYKVGDLACYIPIDSIVDITLPEFNFLTKKRIKAKRLRGIYSQGLLISTPEGFKEGDSVVDHFGLKKYVYQEEVYDLSLLPEEEQKRFYFPDRTVLVNARNGNNESPPKGWSPPHYDLESVRKYGKAFEEGEEVVITEKIDGENIFTRFDGEKLWVKSRNWFKKEDPEDRWWSAVLRTGLDEKVEGTPDLGYYGEVYGRVRPFFYDCELKGSEVQAKIRIFDIFNFKNGTFLDYDEMVKVANLFDIPLAPEIYRGPWKSDKTLYELAEGDTLLTPTIKQATRIMEGFVVRPVKERVSRFGRIVFKLKSERYNLAKK